MWGNAEDRGQSVVLGAILVFALLIVGLAGVQTFIVPQQNEQVELNHQTVIDDDFARLHSGLMNAAEQGENYTASIKLGTRYPSRAFTLNAPAPSGSLRTQDIGEYNRNIPDSSDSLASLCGISGQQTQALEYQPSYNHLSGVGTHGYENTVQFQAVGDDLAELNSNFVSGDTIRLRPLVGGSLGTTSTGSVSTDFYAGTTGKTSNKVTFNSSTVLRLPTTLSQGQWDRIVAEESEITTASVTPAGEVKIELQNGDYTIQCTPIGVGGPPETSPSPSFMPSEDSDSDSDESDSAVINPIGEGALELDSVSAGSWSGSGGGSDNSGGPPDNPGGGSDNSSNGKSLCASFSNNASESRTVTKVRIPFAARTGASNISSINVNGEQVNIGGGYEDSVDITWSSNTPQEVEFTGLSSNVARFALIVEFQDGGTATYFIDTN